MEHWLTDLLFGRGVWLAILRATAFVYEMF